MTRSERQSTPGFLSLCSMLVVGLLLGLPLKAAYISEIDLDGPGGQGIELSRVDPATDYTLLILDANPYSPSAFGLVMDVIHLPAGIGRADLAMVTDRAWPDNTAATTPLASLSPASGNDTLALGFSRLLVVMSGASAVRRFDRPLGTDATARARYDAADVTDWLVLTTGDPTPLYRSNGHDIDHINATLGIDLLSRLIDKDAGRVIGRTHLPGQLIDPDVFFQGDPGPSRQFDVNGRYRYTYTPSQSNLPLTAHLPEPGSLAALSLGAAICLRRRRGDASRAD